MTTPSKEFARANATAPESLWAEAHGMLTVTRSGDIQSCSYAVVGAGFDGLHFVPAPNHVGAADDKYAAAGHTLNRMANWFRASDSSDVQSRPWSEVHNSTLVDLGGGSGALDIKLAGAMELHLFSKYSTISGFKPLDDFLHQMVERPPRRAVRRSWRSVAQS